MYKMYNVVTLNKVKNTIHTQLDFFTFNNHLLHSPNQTESKIYISWSRVKKKKSYFLLHKSGIYCTYLEK